MAKPRTLDEAKRQARELAKRGNDLGWYVSAGKLSSPDGSWQPAVRFQADPGAEHLGDGTQFSPVASFASYAKNPLPRLQEVREQERADLAKHLKVSPMDLLPNPVGRRHNHGFIVEQLKLGNVYVGRTRVGRTLTASAYQSHAGGGSCTYALFVEQEATVTADVDAVVSQLLTLSEPGSVRLGNATRDNPVGIPPSVERYYEETIEQSPQTPPGKAWAVAWSRYCGYKNPESPHCKMRRSDYFPGRQGKGKRGADKLPAAEVILTRSSGPKNLREARMLRDSQGSDVWKKAESKLKEWAFSLPARKSERIHYQVVFQDGEAIEGGLKLTRDWSSGYTFQQAVKAHALFAAGHGAPAGWTESRYAKALKKAADAEFWRMLLAEYDLGDSRPYLPVKVSP